jgi:hypothetical protein
MDKLSGKQSSPQANGRRAAVDTVETRR